MTDPEYPRKKNIITQALLLYDYKNFHDTK